jgi:membrane protease YdiL (CAAX protease family)
MALFSIVRSSAIGYGILLGVAALLGLWQGRLGELFPSPVWPATGVNVLIGVVLAAGVLSASAAFRATFEWARRLEDEFRLLLGDIDVWGAFVLALSSGIAEEAFFRGVMQSAFGLTVTSVAFGLLHFPVNRRLIPWTLIAVAMGFVFGVVYQETSSLLAVALAHGLINFVELVGISKAQAGGASGSNKSGNGSSVNGS